MKCRAYAEYGQIRSTKRRPGVSPRLRVIPDICYTIYAVPEHVDPKRKSPLALSHHAEKYIPEFTGDRRVNIFTTALTDRFGRID